jgi:hypothetical protein
MFRNRRRLRRWAAQVLLAWLFGLAMGVANACALGESADHERGGDTAFAIGEHHHDGHAGHDSGQGKANCLNFCEKSAVGAPKLTVADDGAAKVGLPALLSARVGVIELPAPLPVRVRADSLNLRGSPPLRIALQRLAL